MDALSGAGPRRARGRLGAASPGARAAAAPWARFSAWLECVCVVTFDLELGQALEVSGAAGRRRRRRRGRAAGSPGAVCAGGALEPTPRAALPPPKPCAGLPPGMQETGALHGA
ncbi:hypothetical protein GH733_017418 [Mirounga leonina]|nr:hypothetical protein GH733_017418 [Mirounga leonina]